MYPNEELIDVLAPAYDPCPHMSIHGGECRESRWKPEAGHVPRGFLGATGDLREVKLVIVLAEPGEPKSRERYVDGLASSDMVRRVVDFVHGTYAGDDRAVHGTVQQVVCWFLHRFFGGLSFEQQLRRVWITQARLCSRGEGSFSQPFYRSCGDIYLAAQLRLLPEVPIVAFGDKAHKALGRLRVQAIEVPHPSARTSKESKCQQWEQAIVRLKGKDAARASTLTVVPGPATQQWPSSNRQVDPQGTSRVRPQVHEDVMERATGDGLPAPVATFLVAAARVGYEVRWWHSQNKSVLYDGCWLGGWNCRAKHWYVRTLALGERTSLLSQHDFQPRRNGTLWLRSGRTTPKEATDAFHSVIRALTGVTVPLPE